jgi:hypothetical protein
MRAVTVWFIAGRATPAEGCHLIFLCFITIFIFYKDIAIHQ